MDSDAIRLLLQLQAGGVDGGLLYILWLPVVPLPPSGMTSRAFPLWRVCVCEHNATTMHNCVAVSESRPRVSLTTLINSP